MLPNVLESFPGSQFFLALNPVGSVDSNQVVDLGVVPLSSDSAGIFFQLSLSNRLAMVHEENLTAILGGRSLN